LKVELKISKNVIGKALNQIVNQLNDYLDTKYVGSNPTDYRAEIQNIQEDPTGSNPGIKVALINIEEDKVYKNHLNPLDRLPKSTDDIHPLGGIPTMRVNLYVLFAFNPKASQSAAYLNSLSLVTHVLSYFAATPYQKISIPPTGIPDKQFNLEINYHNISLEDSNNMWSNLGGKQKPYAMFQIKMLEIEGDTHVPIPMDKVLLKPPIISNPEYDATTGKTLYNSDGSPQNDTNKITHKNN